MMRLIGAAAASYIDHPPRSRTWSSLEQAVNEQSCALDILEREENNLARFAVGLLSLVLVASGLLMLVFAVVALLDGDVRRTDDELWVYLLGSGMILLVVGRKAATAFFAAETRIAKALSTWYALLETIAMPDEDDTFERLRRADALSTEPVRRIARQGSRRRVARWLMVIIMAEVLMVLVVLAAVVTLEPSISIVTTMTAGCVAILLVSVGPYSLLSARASTALRKRTTRLRYERAERDAAPSELQSFTEALDVAADRAGVQSPPVRIVLGRGLDDHSVAQVQHVDGRDQVAVWVGLVDAPPTVQRFVAAHEVAHLELGHLRRGTATHYVRSCLSVLAVVALVGGGSYWVTSTVSQALPVILLLLCGVVGFLSVAMLADLAASLRRSRLRELAADRRAANYGFPLTAEAAHWRVIDDSYEQDEGRRYARLWSSHPTWSQRLVAAGAADG